MSIDAICQPCCRRGFQWGATRTSDSCTADGRLVPAQGAMPPVLPRLSTTTAGTPGSTSLQGLHCLCHTWCPDTDATPYPCPCLAAKHAPVNTILHTAKPVHRLPNCWPWERTRCCHVPKASLVLPGCLLTSACAGQPSARSDD